MKSTRVVLTGDISDDQVRKFMQENKSLVGETVLITNDKGSRKKAVQMGLQVIYVPDAICSYALR